MLEVQLRPAGRCHDGADLIAFGRLVDVLVVDYHRQHVTARTASGREELKVRIAVGVGDEFLVRQEYPAFVESHRQRRPASEAHARFPSAVVALEVLFVYVRQ